MVLWTIGAVVVAAVLFAPIMTVGWCADSATPGASYCASEQRSILGAPTSIWLWLGATAVFGGLAWLLSRGYPRRVDS